MRLLLVHHAQAVDAQEDTRQPLSAVGRAQADAMAQTAAARGEKPAVVWHSGKLRTKQTAEAVWRACNALAQFGATRDVQPTDHPRYFGERLVGETRDLAVVGHMPHLDRLLTFLLAAGAEAPAPFPTHGVVVLESDDQGRTWREVWRAC